MKHDTYMNKNLAAALVLFSAVGTAWGQDADIKAYCFELAKANAAGADWFQRCMANAQVRRNHQAKAEESSRLSQAVDVRLRKNEWILAFYQIKDELKAANSDEQKARASKRSDYLFTDCSSLFSAAECLKFTDELK